MAQSQRVAALPGREHTANAGTKIQHFAWRWANSVVQLPLQNSPRDQAPAETTACLLAPSPAPSCFPHPPSHKRTLSINCVCWLYFKGAWLKIVHMLSDFSLPLKASSISTQPLRIMHFFTLPLFPLIYFTATFAFYLFRVSCMPQSCYPWSYICDASLLCS